MTEPSRERDGEPAIGEPTLHLAHAPEPRVASSRWQTLPGLLFALAVTSVLAVAGAPGHPGAVPGSNPPVDFTTDVRPILSAHCFACHGPDAEGREGDLSLVDAASALTGGRSGRPAIVPGAPDRSELWRRVRDPLDPMPPAEAHAPLSPGQKEILHRWITEGADYAPHWAYEFPERRPDLELPPGRDPVDVLLERRWQEMGIQPSPPADRVTLLRRLSFDLNGLPPRPADLDRYRNVPHALSDFVDALLDSPRFGERLAVRWLDLVRYADTVGYHGDQEHRIWPYRDWVIRAFNDGLPFDRFTRLQLAGDLVAEESPELDAIDRQDALVASGYNRLLQTSHEGGLQLAEYRAIYMADRVRNASDVWLGGTLGCAQCHDHKYDPYTHTDFHTFGAFFADIDDEAHLRDPYAGYNTTPTRREPEMRVASREHRALLAEVDRRRQAIEDRIDRTLESLEREDPDWERTLLARGETLEDRRVDWVDDRLDTGGTASGDWRFERDARIAPHSGDTYRIQQADGLVQHYTVGTTRRIEVESDSRLEAWIHLDLEHLPRAVMLQVHAEGSWEHRAVWGDDSIPYGRQPEDAPAYRRRGPLPPTGDWRRLEVPLVELGLDAGTRIDGIAFTQFGGRVLWDDAAVVHPGVAPPEVLQGLLRSPAERDQRTRDAIRAFRASTDSEVLRLRTDLRALETERTTIEEGLPLTLHTRRLTEPRVVRILPRGDWLDESGRPVQPAVPAFLGSVAPRHPEHDRADRLDLADWLCRPGAEGGIGELTARVFVNRIWAMLFGEGLCPSQEDFGGQGRPPTHPELLDLLALDFMESGWDVKGLIRRLVLTDAYARSSVPAGEAATLDPDNLLFARQSRHRLDAEFVRDAALQIGGLLQFGDGGPSVKPPQPDGHYRHLNFPPRRYHPDTDERQWRRGVYVHWQRQFLHPMLKAFDAPNRESCTAERAVSNTPLAALVLLNDPVFVEAARGLATRMLAAGELDRERLAAGWRLAVGRQPLEAELEVLQGLLDESRSTFAADPDAANRLRTSIHGGSDSSPGPGMSPAELASWIQTGRAILNLHETYTRE